MTIFSVTKMWSRSNGNEGSEDGRTFKAAYTEGYQVEHSADATTIEILSAAGIPRIGSIYPGTQAVFAKARSRQEVGLVLSVVTVNYSGEFGPGGSFDNPISRPPEIEWTNATSNEAIDTDGNGVPITTVNNEPIEGVTKDINDWVLSVKRNFTFISIPTIQQYLDSVNADTFAGWAPGTAALTAFSARIAYGNFAYWEVSAKIVFRVPYNTTPDKAWYARIRHEGFYIKDGSNRIVRAVDENKQPRVKPVLLTSTGTEETDPSNAHFLEVKKKQYSLPYTALGLI